MSRTADDGDDRTFGGSRRAPCSPRPFELPALRAASARRVQGVRMSGQQPAARRRRRRAGHSRRGQPVRAARRLRRRCLLERPRRDRAAADAPRRPGHGRSADAGRRRPRRAARHSRDRSALPGRADDRLRVGRHRGRGDQARRDRLPEQAARLRAARAAARRRARRSRAAAQPAVDRRRRRAAARVLRHDRPRRR